MDVSSLQKIFEEIADLLELKGENPFKIKAYRYAGRALEGIEDLEKMVSEKRLKEIKGIGEAIAKKIEEFYEKGHITYHEELKREFPPSLLELLKIPNLGPKRVKELYEKVGVTNVGELEYAIRENRLLTLFGFGKKIQERILEGIEFYKANFGKLLLVEAEKKAEIMVKTISSLSANARVEICGSVRRKSETVSDLDILVIVERSEEIDKIGEFLKRSSKTHSVNGDLMSLISDSGYKMDVLFAKKEEYPFSLTYLTGSRSHFEKLQLIASNKGFSLSPRNLSKEGKSLSLEKEEALYEILGLPYIPPEMREDTGEIELSISGNLPKILEESEIKGVLHIHTDFSDGIDSIESLKEFAKELGLEYIGVSDHSKSAYYARGLDVERLKRQWEIIDMINRQDKDFYVFKGIEVDILPDGSLDYPDEILERFDFVIASIHTHFRLPRKEQTRRIIKALENPFVTVLGHLTGRLLLTRQGYEIDLEEIMDFSSKTGKILELNSSPYRLDLGWKELKEAKSKGIMVSIGPDAHSKNEIKDLRFGVYQARKAWLEKKDVLNTMTKEGIRDLFLRRRGCKR